MKSPDSLYFENQNRVLYTDPEMMAQLTKPDRLAEPGKFYISDALNMYNDYGRYGNDLLDDNMQYLVRGLRLDPKADPDSPYQRSSSVRSSFCPIDGDESQGPAFAVLTELPSRMAKLPYGPLIRMHSACGYSEIGQKWTSHIYKDPRWFYDRRTRLHPIFTQYGDGIVAGYPEAIFNRRSLDCDCRAQRIDAQQLITAMGGMYISLAGRPQEARGYGPEVKRELYRIQTQKGLNTKEAFDDMGLPSYDIRRYDHVAKFLAEDLRLTRVVLMTNNLRKVAALEDAGIEVTKASSVTGIPNRKVYNYTQTKTHGFGHTAKTDVFINGFAGAIWIEKRNPRD